MTRFSPTHAVTLLAALLVVLLIILLRPVELPAGIVVNSLADNTLVDGNCTFREAILTSNGTGNGDCPGITTLITFSASGTITVTSALPSLTAGGVTIDGDIGNDETLDIILDGVSLTGGENGLRITSPNNTIRWLAIVRFPANGLLLTGSNANNNQIIANMIGTIDAPMPFTDYGNNLSGIRIEGGAHTNQIGGQFVAIRAGNTISQNNQHGVLIQGIGTGDPLTETRGNVIIGNDIGLAFVGPLDEGNTSDGIAIFNGAINNRIGGAANERNVIGFSGIHGIHLADPQTQNNTISRNFIGVTTSLLAIPNTNGIVITNSANNNLVNNANVIGRNINAGILLTTSANNNTITGNLIGEAPLGSIPNSTGINLLSGANNNTINSNTINTNQIHGVAIAGLNTNNNQIILNTIEGNLGDGVNLVGSNIGNLISQNVMLGNGNLGIDLNNDGLTPNDLQDIDNGPNRLQNFPVLSAAFSDGVATRIDGTFNSVPNLTFTIEFFANAAADPSGFGEGEIYLGSATVTTDSAGDTTFVTTLGVSTLGQLITATASRVNGDTSEFSNAIPVIPGIDLEITKADAPDPVNVGNTITYTLTVTNLSTANATNVSITDTLPAQVTFVSASPGCTHNTGVVTCTIATIGANLTVNRTITVQADVAGNAVNNASVDANETDVDLSNNTATISTTILDNPTPTPSNTPIPLTSTNTAIPPTSTNTPIASLTFTPSPTVTLTASRTPSQTPSATLTPTITLSPTATATRTPLPSATHTASPTATLTATPSQTLTPSLTPSLTATVTPSLTLTLSPTVIPPTATRVPAIDIDKEQTDDDEITITIENRGEDIDNLVVEEQLEPEVIYLSSSPGNPLCQEVAGVITCTLGSLDSGESTSVTIIVDSDNADIFGTIEDLEQRLG
ncbi:MAG: CSLREA domain-containing protein [Anaerolineae bacterium]|nr:CSLREA domain-containing protein [Anaerolineae bacterium]